MNLIELLLWLDYSDLEPAVEAARVIRELLAKIEGLENVDRSRTED